MYRGLNTSCGANVEVLRALVLARHETSRRLGFASFAHRVLDDKVRQKAVAVSVASGPCDSPTNPPSIPMVQKLKKKNE